MRIEDVNILYFSIDSVPARWGGFPEMPSPAVLEDMDTPEDYQRITGAYGGVRDGVAM